MKRKLFITSASVAALIVVSVLLAWTKPWTAFIDTTVDEERVSSVAAEETAGGDSAVSTAPAIIATGVFVSQDHPTTGTIEIVELPDGSLTLTLVDLATDNGPDVHVYLGSNATNIKSGAFVDLGLMKGNLGTQNYEIPVGLDISAFSVVSLWCEDFAVPFGFAQIEKL